MDYRSLAPPRLDQQLRARDLFPAGRPPIHINDPRHDGHTPLHDHDFYEIAVVETGRATHRDVHGLTPVGAHCLILVQPGQWHAYEHCRHLRLANITFARELVHTELAWAQEDLAALLQAQPAIRIHQFRSGDLIELRRHIDGLRELLDWEEPQAVTVIARLLLVLGEVQRLLPPLADAEHKGLPPALRRCLGIMEQQLAHDWSVPELAQLVACGPSYLSRLFKRHLGSSPIAWLNRRRCERAAVRLLTTGEAIATIGAQVGWHDANYFARRFRACFGQSPRAYRQQLPVPANQALVADWVQW